MLEIIFYNNKDNTGRLKSQMLSHNVKFLPIDYPLMRINRNEFF